MSNEIRRPVLSREELAGFRREGFVRLPRAFPPHVAEAIAQEVWDELRETHGIDRADPSTWRVPPGSPRHAKRAEWNDAVATPRFLGAIGDLLGRDDWERPNGWGGFLVNFPQETDEPWSVPADAWHADGDPTMDGLLIFSFYAPVEPRGGGTLIVAGSHLLRAALWERMTPEERGARHKVHRRLFARFDPWLEALTGALPVPDRTATFLDRETEVRGVPCRVVELTGEPGDVVLCSPAMLHSAAPNHARVPRLMRVKHLNLEAREGEPGSRGG